MKNKSFMIVYETEDRYRRVIHGSFACVGPKTGTFILETAKKVARQTGNIVTDHSFCILGIFDLDGD